MVSDGTLLIEYGLLKKIYLQTDQLFAKHYIVIPLPKLQVVQSIIIWLAARADNMNQFCTVIGYPTRQNCLLGTTRYVPKENIFFFPIK